jgi:FolB domain-containing protein
MITDLLCPHSPEAAANALSREGASCFDPVQNLFPMSDLILIDSLELHTCIGVPDEERERPQRLTVNLAIQPVRSMDDMEDDFAHAVDYFELSRRVQDLAGSHSRRLIETLVTEIADLILKSYPVRAVTVELRKYILPDTTFVAVKVHRQWAEKANDPADEE